MSGTIGGPSARAPTGPPFWPEPSQVPQAVWDNPYTYKITPKILAREHGRGWQAALTACLKLAPRALPYTAALQALGYRPNGTHARGVSVALSLAFRPASDNVHSVVPMISERRI